MERLIPIVLALFIGTASLLLIDTAAATTKPVRCCQPVRHQNPNVHSYTFYEAPYCDYHACNGITREFCHPARYVKCHADMCS